MNETLKNLEKKNVILSSMLIVLGILLVWKPIGFIKSIVIIIGAVLFIMAIVDFISYFNSDQRISNTNLFKGIIEFIAAILLIFRNDVLIDLFPIIIGVILIFNNIFKLQLALSVKQYDSKKWTYGFVASLIGILVGVIIVLNPFDTLELVIRIAGIIILINEISSLIYTGVIYKTVRTVVDAVNVEVIDSKHEITVVDAEVEDSKENSKNKKSKKK